MQSTAASKSITTKPTTATQPITSAEPSTSKPSTSKALAPTNRSAGSFLDQVDQLLKGAGKIHSDRPILTRNDSEWLNDCQIGNDNHMLSKPSFLRILPPLSEEHAANWLSLQAGGSRLLEELLDKLLPHKKYSVILPFAVQRLHWHELFMPFTEKVLYHFEAFGGPVEPRVAAAFASTLLPRGWELINIRIRVQNDGSSCGVWVQAARDAFLAYIESEEFGTKSFAAFLERWLENQGVVRLAPACT